MHNCGVTTTAACFSDGVRPLSSIMGVFLLLLLLPRVSIIKVKSREPFVCFKGRQACWVGVGLALVPPLPYESDLYMQSSQGTTEHDGLCSGSPKAKNFLHTVGCIGSIDPHMGYFEILNLSNQCDVLCIQVRCVLTALILNTIFLRCKP